MWHEQKAETLKRFFKPQSSTQKTAQKTPDLSTTVQRRSRQLSSSTKKAKKSSSIESKNEKPREALRNKEFRIIAGGFWSALRNRKLNKFCSPQKCSSSPTFLLRPVQCRRSTHFSLERAVFVLSQPESPTLPLSTFSSLSLPQKNHRR